MKSSSKALKDCYTRIGYKFELKTWLLTSALQIYLPKSTCYSIEMALKKRVIRSEQPINWGRKKKKKTNEVRSILGKDANSRFGEV